MKDDHEPTAEEIEAFHREDLLAPESVTADEYPRAWNRSAGFIYKRIVRPHVPAPPEYVTLPLSDASASVGEGRWDVPLAMAKWNLLWEAAQFRRRFFSDDDLPDVMREIADRGDVNVVFVPRTVTRYYEYSPLFHLLSRSAVERHGLPLIRAGQWPFLMDTVPVDRYLPADFEDRLSRAWAWAVWRHLMPGSPQRAFSKSDPIRLLAHNLDFWLPPVTAVIQEILRGLGVVDATVAEDAVHLEDGTVLEGAAAASPRVGSDLWRGEADAAEVVRLTVDQADADGRLRGILDAVRSNRVEDDFSEHWSYAREDFERKLYHKRSKVKVRFVELTDTIPVQGPEVEVEDSLVFSDFLALLDERERQVVVVLHSGVTRIGEIASILGYKNHSPVSKRLARIRKKAAEYFGVP
ncbi:sigma-70 family RNA polymerase sigma factor [Microtetraspora malaysiensis]|uniref:sigma-70 family RNA polymerase sigma factor n=1 Tax=Microtetraspora malaysiensis TaxID=161358 RepID=UPI003D8F717B